MSFRSLVTRLREMFRSMGLDISPYPRLGTVEYHFSRYPVDVLIDVGANCGQYAGRARRWGFKNKIISFEPVTAVFNTLQQKAASDPLWQCHNMALGDANQTSEINVSQSTTLSSLLQPSEQMSQTFAKTGTIVQKQQITVRRLDGIIDKLDLTGKSIWLKTDTQGYDLAVIRGAEGILDQVQVIQMELSIRPLYDQQSTLDEVIVHLRERGFLLIDVILGGRDSVGLLEVDGIFIRQKTH